MRRPEHVRGVHRHDLDPEPLAGLEGGQLALVLGVRVDQAGAASGYGFRSFAARSAGAGPIDATLEVTTTRRTPRAPPSRPRSAARSRSLARPAARGRDATIPAVWNSTSQPANARRIERRSSMSASTASTSSPASARSRRAVPDGHPDLVARARRRAATWAPMNPVAPVTHTLIGVRPGGRAARAPILGTAVAHRYL